MLLSEDFVKEKVVTLESFVRDQVHVLRYLLRKKNKFELAPELPEDFLEVGPELYVDLVLLISVMQGQHLVMVGDFLRVEVGLEKSFVEIEN